MIFTREQKKKKKKNRMILVTDHANDGILACVYEN